MNKKNIIFRRYKGRIIPIKTKREDYIKGSGAIAGALGATVLGGYAAGKSVGISAQLRHTAKRYYRIAKSKQIHLNLGRGFIGKKLIKNPLKAARYMRYASSKAFSLRNPILAGATILGGALLSSGAERIYKAKTGKNFSMTEQVGSDLFSVTVGGLTAAAYYKFIPTGRKLKAMEIFKQTMARVRKTKRPAHIPIKHRQGVLRFD